MPFPKPTVLPYMEIFDEINGEIRAEQASDVGIKVEVDIDGDTAEVVLETMQELQRLVDELNDPDGELMYTEGSICGKYLALRQYRP